MNIKTYRTHFIQELLSIYDALEAETLFYLILEEKNQLKQIHLALNPELEFTDDDLLYWENILCELKNENPVQYLLEKAHFFGLEFKVNQAVLIPRPETEELVDWIIKSSKSSFSATKKIKILDIGTGSGCIAISLAKNIPNAEVYGLDVSKEAIQMALHNAKLNNAKVTFFRKDILEAADLGQEFDIIVSNPPYIRNLEKTEIKNNVLNHEPHLALFVEDDDALVFYNKIAQLAKGSLARGGKVFFEINQYLGKEMVSLLEENYFKNIELKKDIYENDRMIKCEF